MFLSDIVLLEGGIPKIPISNLDQKSRSAPDKISFVLKAFDTSFVEFL